MSDSLDRDRLLAAYRVARHDLVAEQVPAGHWVGELSSSALSTATAVSALSLVARHRSGLEFEPLVTRGLKHLAACQNADGGWGDTDQSHSNIATTMLVQAAIHLAGRAAEHASQLERSGRYVEGQGGLAGLRRRYGQDKTFAVPILTNCALAGLVPWNEVDPLPFEMACLPRGLLGLARLPVVSYAIPALVAIGQAHYYHRPPRNPAVRLVRHLSRRRSLDVLDGMQPPSGGFLEATPLTSFVVMSLAAIGHGEHPVVLRGVQFLAASVREDGSWPIDTNLATWVTSLAIHALSITEDSGIGPGGLKWLLGCQHREVHPFTGASPGGWGWTNLSGAVPDADDTPGALLALAALGRGSDETSRRCIEEAAEAGISWLLDLQNSDGGWPTFCRGWGTLPFDRSGADLTAHALRALSAWKDRMARRGGRIERAMKLGLAYLERKQRADGSWIPLWFGNQDQPDEENPVYGTARVLMAYRDLRLLETSPARRAIGWLLSHRGRDGGWGGAERQRAGGQMSSVEETALAVEALLGSGTGSPLEPEVVEGVNWLIGAVESGRHREPAPIGFYFARLWYYERLYPLIFTVAALGQAVRRLAPGAIAEASHPACETTTPGSSS